jgi:hypothetical protein
MNASVPNSLDGRYFGPLLVSSVIGIATPLALRDVSNYSTDLDPLCGLGAAPDRSRIDAVEIEGEHTVVESLGAHRLRVATFEVL